MEDLIQREIVKLQRTRNFAIAYTSSLFAGSFGVAKNGTFFADYFPLFQEELQKAEEFFRQPGMGLACLLTFGLVYVSGVAMFIHEYYNEKIEQVQERELFY